MKTHTTNVIDPDSIPKWRHRVCYDTRFSGLEYSPYVECAPKNIYGWMRGLKSGRDSASLAVF